MLPTNPPPAAARRHLRWAIPLVAAPTSLVAALTVLALLTQRTGDHQAPGQSMLILAVATTGLAVPFALVVTAAVQVGRIRRDARHRAGRFSATERRAREQHLAAQAASAHAWHLAVDTARILVRGGTPATCPVWDVVPWQGEQFYADVPIGYARYYGTTVHYTQSGGLYVGRPAFVAAGLATTALFNAAARSAAQREAAEQWRGHGTVRLVVSDRRLLVQRHGEWLTFAHSAVSAVYPDLEHRAVVCQFPDTAPMVLWGDFAALAAVVVVASTHGADALARHPALAALGLGAPPALPPAAGTAGVTDR